MKTSSCIAAAYVVMAAAAVVFRNSAMAEEEQTFGTIERLDPRFDELLAPDAKLEKLVEAFEWSEGPVWVPPVDTCCSPTSRETR